MTLSVNKQKFLEKHLLFLSLRAKVHSSTLRQISRTKSAMFLDLDGTIWPDRGPGSILLDESLDMVDIKTILELKRKFDFLIIVTNQTLFSRSKQINQEVLLRYKNKISKLQTLLGFDLFLVCHHHPNAQNPMLRKECWYRKPSVGLFAKSIELLGLDPQKSLMVGDRITDLEASSLAGIKNGFLVSNEFAFKRNIGGNEITQPGVFFRPIHSLTNLISICN